MALGFSVEMNSAPWVRLPTLHGEFSARVFTVDGVEHLVLTHGEVAGDTPVLVRVHSECLTGDVFSSRRCDCGPQLDLALRKVAAAERGVLIYLRGQEGRGIGLGAKLAAYALQEKGLDTVDANIHLGLPIDARGYDAAVDILCALGVSRVQLLTNNPDKLRQMSRSPLEIIERIPLQVPVHEDTRAYLETKRQRLGHWLEL